MMAAAAEAASHWHQAGVTDQMFPAGGHALETEIIGFS